MAEADRVRSVALRILSPAVEVGDGLNLHNVPLDTTVGALKQMLTDTIASHPTPDRMRLIHFGRLFSNDNDTLAQLFGDAALHQTAPITLHLVVRAPPTPMETAATRAPPFSSWGPPSNAAPAAPAAPQPNILPPGVTQHPLLRGPAAFIPPAGATATPPHPAAPHSPTPPIQQPQHVRSPSANLLHQLMERQQQQLRELHQQRPQSHPPPQVPPFLRPDAQLPNPPASAPVSPQPHAHPHPHPHRHASITINRTTMTMPQIHPGANNFPIGQIPLPVPLPLQAFPPLLNPFNNAPRPQIQHFNPTLPTVYLLSSPQGPQALVFSPQGTFTANMPQLQQPYYPLAHGPSISNPFLDPTRPHTPTVPQQQPAEAVPQRVVIDPQQPPEQIAQQVLQQMNQGGQENQQFDALAPWQPLLAQGWMLLRLLFFAWIFLGTGQGWRRPAAMFAIGLVFWLINAGGFGNSIRDAVRSWWEGVVGLPPRNNAQQPGQNQPAPVEQQEQQHGAIRQALRPAERALALFVASLWPGVGERTVTARREEEERQRREEQERQRAEEERQRQLEGEQTTTSEDAANPGENDSVPAGESIESNATATATGANLSAARQEVRERKAAVHESGAGESVTSEPALSREEQSAQQTRNLSGDW